MNASPVCDYCHLPIPGGVRSRRPDDDRPLYCCYGCKFAAQVTQSRGEQGHATWMLTRLGVSAFLSMGVMVFSLAMYSQEVYDLDPAKASSSAVQLTGLLRYVSLVLATPVFLLLGLPILSNAIDQFRRTAPSTDALVVLGVAAAYLYSYVSTLTDRGAVYYETACMILVLITLGRYLEATGKLRASAAVRELEALIPDEVSIRRGDTKLTVPTADIRLDDLIHVPAGRRIAADGCIEEGSAHVDEQIVTGESVPAEKRVGDQVAAGSLNTDGSLVVRATGVGSDSALARLIALLERAKGAKGRYERLADRVVTFFVPAVVLLAAVGVMLGYRRAGVNEAIMTGLAVLLISCPCALGIATPMAIWVGLGRAARAGVLFRDGETVERFACVRAFALDKTGTLTTGAPSAHSFTVDEGRDESERALLAGAAGLAKASTHVLARGVLEFARGRDVEPAVVVDARTLPGKGVVATLHGTTIRLGNHQWMKDASLGVSPAIRDALHRLVSPQCSIVCLGWGDAMVGIFTFTEQLRPEAECAVAELTALDCRLAVLTGDHQARGEAIASQIGVETFAHLQPGAKIEHIGRLRRSVGPVAMVGDGLNDAPALAEADVGIAMGCGADLTRDAGDVCLLGNDLTTLPWALRLARRTVRTIKGNLFWAFAYNLVGVSLALTGRLSPMFAAGAMVLSSLFVVTNSLRMGQFEPLAVRKRQVR